MQKWNKIYGCVIKQFGSSRYRILPGLFHLKCEGMPPIDHSVRLTSPIPAVLCSAVLEDIISTTCFLIVDTEKCAAPKFHPAQLVNAHSPQERRRLWHDRFLWTFFKACKLSRTLKASDAKLRPSLEDRNDVERGFAAPLTDKKLSSRFAVAQSLSAPSASSRRAPTFTEDPDQSPAQPPPQWRARSDSDGRLTRGYPARAESHRHQDRRLAEEVRSASIELH